MTDTGATAQLDARHAVDVLRAQRNAASDDAANAWALVTQLRGELETKDTEIERLQRLTDE